jgi:oxygen-independent coproporphyrinogen-3 oxidase
VPEPEAEPGFGVYVHWPFCLAKCPYCDFNSHVAEGVDEGRWGAALVAETLHTGALAPGRSVSSVFFGGGTPSLMAPATVAAVLEAIARAWPLAADAEVSLEANPTSTEAGRFRDYRAAGVNRLSLGVQALDDRALEALGRGHSAAEARAAITLSQRLFKRTSFDLIYARPGQSAADWRRELGRALALAGDHLSLYQLTLEPGTEFHRAARRGALELPADDLAAGLYEDSQGLCEAAGLAAYEVSNHARPGAECRHNLGTWRGGEYAAIGPGGHGRLAIDGRRQATRQIRAPEAWLAAVEGRGHGTRSQTPLDAEEGAAEALMLGLRLGEGVSRARLRRLGGRDLEDFVAAGALERLVAGGFLELDRRALRATAAGRRVLNAVLAELLP